MREWIAVKLEALARMIRGKPAKTIGPIAQSGGGSGPPKKL